MEYVFTLTPAGVVYWAITLAWFAEFVVFRSRSYGRKASSARELVILAVAVTAAFAVCGAAYHLRLGMLPDSWRGTVRAVGLGLYAGGVLLRYWAAHVLGAWFSRDLRTSPDQTLISHGPYARLRHPLYLGLLLAVAGTNISMGSWLGAALGVALLVLALLRRIAREEQSLEHALGDRYRAWKLSRYRLLPPVY